MLYSTRLRIHLGNIAENLRAIHKAVGAERTLLWVVKADGYGHGAVPLARKAQEENLVDWFGVATVPEAIELREAGITLPILKLSPAFENEMAAALEHDVTLTVADPDNADALERTCRGTGRRASIHLKIDTGLARIGVDPQDAAALARHLDEHCPHLSLDGVFTHLSVADVPAEDPFTERQLDLFGDAVAAVSAATGRTPPHVHAANSAGILAHGRSWLTMVRAGIIGYGALPGPTAARSIPLFPGLSWVSRVSFVKTVEAGTTVSYGRTWTAPRTTRIATVPVGYGDGLSRFLSNRGRFLVNGRSYPIAGRVCMDQTMIDVGDSPDVSVGDEVVIVGGSGDLRITIEEMAGTIGTVPYELFCYLTPRMPRDYDETFGAA
nr:alanine racemase [bacterium]